MSNTYPTLIELKQSLDQLQAAFCVPCPIEHITMFERVLSLGGPATYATRIGQTRPERVPMGDVYAALGWLHTSGPVAYQHFLPRVCAIMALEPFWFWEAAGIGERLKALQWKTWPSFQQRAITRFVERWIRWALQEPSVSLDALSESLALGRVLSAERAWLPALLGDDPEQRFFERLVSWLASEDVRAVTYRMAGGCALVRELQRPDTIALLEEAFFAAADEEEAARVSEAVERIEWYLR